MPVEPLTSTSMLDSHNWRPEHPWPSGHAHTGQPNPAAHGTASHGAWWPTHLFVGLHTALAQRQKWLRAELLAEHTLWGGGGGVGCVSNQASVRTPTPNAARPLRPLRYPYLRQHRSHKLGRLCAVRAVAVKHGDEHLVWAAVVVDDSHRILCASAYHPSHATSHQRHNRVNNCARARAPTAPCSATGPCAPRTWFSFERFIGSFPGREKHAKVMGSSAAFVSRLSDVTLCHDGRRGGQGTWWARDGRTQGSV